jgi:hypothetical protein
MPLPFSLGQAQLRKKATLTNLIPSINALLTKSNDSDKNRKIISQINQNITLITNSTLSSDERKRIPTNYKDILDLTNTKNLWCWINCSMRLSTVEMREFINQGKLFKDTYDTLNRELNNTSPNIDNIVKSYKDLINQRIELNNLKIKLQSLYPPKELMEVQKPNNNGSSGPPGWAQPLANIYAKVDGPKGVSTEDFIEHLRFHQRNLSLPDQQTVHGSLSEFGTTRKNAAVTLRNWLKKSKSSLPNSFRNIFSNGTYKGGNRKRRITRKNRKRN